MTNLINLFHGNTVYEQFACLKGIDALDLQVVENNTAVTLLSVEELLGKYQYSLLYSTI